MEAEAWAALPQNMQKSKLFSYVFKRIDVAIESGFYLEAITLCESMIVNRVFSVMSNSSDREIFSRGFSRILNELESDGVHLFTEGLLQDTRDWLSGRNMTIHGIAKIEEFQGTPTADRISETRRVAEAGKVLATKWKNEASKHRI